MEPTCPHCGAKYGRAAVSARGVSCPACGRALRVGEGARRARAYDGYAVGRRVLRLAPAWLLLTLASFALALLLLSLVGRRDGEPPGEAFKNEATNRPPAPVERAREEVPAVKASREAGEPFATPAPPAQGPDEADAYSVQVGAFVDLSQANEQVSRLRAAGFEARVVESEAATRFRFRVRSGRYTTREEATRQAELLRAAGIAAQTVIVEPARK